jgi:hypothetical protein
MATAGSIVTRALRILGVCGIGRDPSAEEMADGLAALRDMLASWEMEGVRLGALVGVDLSTTTVMPLPASHIDPVQYNLAARLSIEYGRPLNPAAGAMADRGFASLQTAYVQVPQMTLDAALTSSSRRYGRYV